MEKLLLPSKISWEKGKEKNEEVVTIEPFYYGYGLTVGNALRRVLLSSLPGAAVTSIKIKGVQHEFSAIPGIKEDAIQIVLNFKKLRVKVHSADPVRLNLKVSGSKTVTAADIEKNSDVEIINKDLVLFELSDSKVAVEMQITVAQGRGYEATENRDYKVSEIGEIAIDSIFTPVVNVGLNVENTRVGNITNFDKLVLTIETDGSITAKEAFQQSVDILMDHFNILKNGPEKDITSEASVEEKEIESDTASDDSSPAEEETPKKKRGRAKKSE